MDDRAWLDHVIDLYRRYKKRCERAAGQLTDAQLLATVGQIPHSVGVLLKHLGRNHSSRWRDFLTTDGEKRDRAREEEFSGAGETVEGVWRQWEEGWRTAFASLESLEPADLERTVTIRGEPHKVYEAIQRNLGHVIYHCGQIVLLARHFTGDAWQTLSIAPGESDAFNASMRARYGDWWEGRDLPSGGTGEWEAPADDETGGS